MFTIDAGYFFIDKLKCRYGNEGMILKHKAKNIFSKKNTEY